MDDKMLEQVMIRLDKFENKLDKMTEALTVMARTEERVSFILQESSRISEGLAKIGARLYDLEEKNAKQSKSIDMFERAAWLIVTAGAGAVAWMWRS